jgi:cell wall assembly regulator SMI1
MVELVLDVHCEFDPLELAKCRDPKQAVAEASRAAAQDECTKAGAKLRAGVPREVHAATLTRHDGSVVLAVASRWVADGPERH